SGGRLSQKRHPSAPTGIVSLAVRPCSTAGRGSNLSSIGDFAMAATLKAPAATKTPTDTQAPPANVPTIPMDKARPDDFPSVIEANQKLVRLQSRLREIQSLI